MKPLIFLCFIFASTLAFAEKSHHHHSHSEKKKHKAHASHVHGHGTLALALEGTEGKLEFKAPSESVVGFEHVAKSEGDLKKVSEISQKIESEISKMVQLSPSSNCQFAKEKIEMVSEKKGKHSDFVAHFTVKCQSSIAGTTVTVDFTNLPNLEELEITVLANEIQKSAQAKKKSVLIELK